MKRLRHAVKRLARRALFGAPSSVTDTRDFRAFCARASREDAVFAEFRRAPALVHALEHVDRETGQQSLEMALACHPGYAELLGVFRRNDAAGNPSLEQFAGFGQWAPTTLRYIKVLSDLEELFGDLNGLRIVEIGAGYGGQARLVLSRFPGSTYIILDLPEPGQLAARYLHALGIQGVSINPPLREVAAQSIDLVISNYALSEIRRSVQEEYLASVVSRAGRGYMLWNDAAVRSATRKRMAAGDLPLRAEEAVTRIRGCRIVRSRQRLLASDMRVGNVLLLWGERDRQ